MRYVEPNALATGCTYAETATETLELLERAARVFVRVRADDYDLLQVRCSKQSVKVALAGFTGLAQCRARLYDDGDFLLG